MSNNLTGDFAPPPEFPQDPEFYRRVLDQWPSPMLVVDAMGGIVFGNQAMLRLGGWSVGEGVGSNILDYVHPEDAGWLAEAFIELAEAETSQSFQESGHWAAIHFRLISADGEAIPVEVTGTAGLEDPVIGGVIYDVRPAHTQEMLHRVLTDLARGEPIDTVLSIVMEMVALPPLGLEAAVIEPRGDGTYRVIGATDVKLQKILEAAVGPMPWSSPADTPTRFPLESFSAPTRDAVLHAGYLDFWHISAEATVTETSYRIVACCPTFHVPSTGARNRLTRASELAGVVLLRARADAVLAYSATHDRLTQLPNREGLSKRLEDTADEQPSTRAVLYIDLDEFKPINDQYGHATGDRVLEVVASRLRSATRSHDLVARIGGDEFAVVLGDSPGRTMSQHQVNETADRILSAISQPIDLDDAVVSVSASIGAVVSDSPAELDVLLERADEAMYRAKRSGGNRHAAD